MLDNWCMSSRKGDAALIQDTILSQTWHDRDTTEARSWHNWGRIVTQTRQDRITPDERTFHITNKMTWQEERTCQAIIHIAIIHIYDSSLYIWEPVIHTYNKKPPIFIIENDEVTLTRTRTTKTDGTRDIHNQRRKFAKQNSCRDICLC